MRICELEIANFRGIKHLKWSGIPEGVVALIGPGDSGKSTVLDAIGVLFHGYWNLTLTENDFFARNLDHPIKIEATVVDPPRGLVQDRQFLAYLRGVDPKTGDIVDEPDNHLPALTIRFSMSSDFEPMWEVVCDRHEEGIRISGDKRRQLGIRRIDATNSDLRWGTRSPLRAVTDGQNERLTEKVLRKAAKKARKTAHKGLQALAPSVKQVKDAAALLRGATSEALFSAELDADLAAISQGSVSLHADDLPVGRAGLGTRRLVSVAVESLSQSGATVLLCDELEIGLEPDRTRHLVRFLQSYPQQVLMTTHSPVVLRELRVEQLVLLRPSGESGVMVARRLAPSEQGPVRSHAEAFLSRRVVVCEGLTEQGFVREICAALEQADPQRLSIAEPINAGGESKIVALANQFSTLGYDTAVVCDSDTNLDLSALLSDVKPLRCDPGLSIEQQILNHATAQGCIEAVRAAISMLEETVVHGQLHSAGITDADTISALIEARTADLDEAPAAAVATASRSKKQPWFKTIAGGERLAQMAADATLITPDPALLQYLNCLREWCAPHDS